MLTRNSRWTGMGITFLVLLLWSLGSGCSDDDSVDERDSGATDAGVSDAIVSDATVDNGPLDCGVPPTDGAVCVQGRLYDFQTDDQVWPGVANQMLALKMTLQATLPDVQAEKSDPTRPKGLVSASGRFTTWFISPDENCLTLVDDLTGYRGGTVNCYRNEIYNYARSGQVDFYLVKESSFENWEVAWPGEEDLASAHPLLLGQCRDANWERLTTGDYIFDVNNVWPHEFYAFNVSRTGFNPGDGWGYGGTIPAGAAFLNYPISDDQGEPLEFIDARLTCNQTPAEVPRLTLEHLQSSAVRTVVLTTTIWD